MNFQDMICINQAADVLNVTSQTVRNWITIGIKTGRSSSQPRIKLGARWHGGRWVTSYTWIDEFNNAVTAARTGTTQASWPDERAAAAVKLGENTTSKKPRRVKA